jgi:mannitol 2-dehydrogenase
VTALPLTTGTLPLLAGRVRIPRYDRVALTPSVVHISVGSFHRSHQAMYFDELARKGHTGWGLIGVGLRRPEMGEALAPQHGLYTVVERGRDGDRAQVVGVIRRYLFAPEGDDVLEALTDPRTRMVTLTVTGDGYGVDPATGLLDPRRKDVQADLVDPARPRTAIGLIVEALRRRRAAGMAPFTVLSCDNVTDNGRIARTAVITRARLRDGDLADWIAEHGAFPSSMVDRITPQTTDEDRAYVAEAFGVADRWPVITEPFSQWIVEDEFACGRPPFEEVGVQVVGDVRPYALMKTRMLNASHCALGFLGSLAGLERTDTAAGDPVFGLYLDQLMADEVVPLLPAVPGVDLDEYRQTTLARLENPKLADRLERLCRMGSGKVPRHVVPSIVAAREHGLEHPRLTLALAGWLRYLRGEDELGRALPLEDPLGPRLRRLARRGGNYPRGVLAERALFGDLGADEAFVRELSEALALLEAVGTRTALRSVVERDGPVPA